MGMTRKKTSGMSIDFGVVVYVGGMESAVVGTFSEVSHGVEIYDVVTVVLVVFV